MNIITFLAHLIPPILVHLWGPCNLHAYGLFILCGLGTFYVLMERDSRRASILSSDQLREIMVWGTVAGVLGGRLLYVLCESHVLETWWESFALWQGGFSMLGTVLAIGCFMSFYLPRAGIPVLQCLDLASFYAPVLHAIARFGCFFAGCCYGIPTTVAWAVMYTDPNSCAPLYEKLHPTQLYSVTAFLAIFVLMVIVRTTIPYRPGLLTTLYMILSGCERFIIDFWRADRCYYPFLPCAVYQAIALGVIGGGLIGLAVLACQTRKEAREYF